MTRRLLVLAALVALLSSPTLVGGQSKPTTKSADPALQKAIDERRAARLTRDIATWSRVTADDAMEIHSSGQVHTKAEEIAHIKAAGKVVDTPDTDKRIRMYGSTAVYTYQRNAEGTPRRVTAVWTKNTAGQWQVVSLQQTQVAKQ
jgi:hypothetical protein